MKLVLEEDPATFGQRTRSFLKTDEVINNGLIAIVDLVASGSPIYSEPFWMGTAEEDGEIVACGVHALPDGLVISEIPVSLREKVYRSIEATAGIPRRILGPKDTIEYLCDSWERDKPIKRRLDAEWELYVIEAGELKMPAARVAGELRKGRADDEELVRRWGKAYGEEKPAVIDVPDFLARKLADGDLLIWDDEGPTTIIAMSGKTDIGIRISAVFTPEEKRGHGYASQAVADVTKRFLEQNLSYVTLHVIAGDPAGRLYRRLGYRQIGSNFSYYLDPRDLANR